MNRLMSTSGDVCSISASPSWIPLSADFDFRTNETATLDPATETPLPGFLNLIYVSFYRELRSDFKRCVDAYFATEPSQCVILIRESDLAMLRSSLFYENLIGKTFVFDSACNLETASIIIRLLERGCSVFTFLPWEYFGKEKRSPLSTLVRSCQKGTKQLTSVELAMSSTLIKERISKLHIRQRFRYI